LILLVFPFNSLPLETVPHHHSLLANATSHVPESMLNNKTTNLHYIDVASELYLSQA